MNIKEKVVKTFVFISLFVAAVFMSVTSVSARDKEVTLRDVDYLPGGEGYALLNESLAELSIYSLPAEVCANNDTIILHFGVEGIIDLKGTFEGEGIVNDTLFVPSMVSEASLDNSIDILYRYSDGVNTFKQSVTVYSIPDINIVGDYTKHTGVCNAVQLRGELLTNQGRVTEYAWTQDDELYSEGFPPEAAPYLSSTNELTTSFSYGGSSSSDESLVYYLYAEDELGCRDTASVNINVHTISAEAGPNVKDVGTCVGNKLDGTDSKGYNLAYSWASAPDNLFSTSSSLADPTTKPLTSDATFILSITDAFGCVDSDSILLNPVELQVSAGEDQTITICENIELAGSISGGAGLSSEWEQVAGPSVFIENSGNLNQSLSNAGAGVYRFRLNALDGFSCSANDEVEITVQDVELDIAASSTEIGSCESATLFVVGSAVSNVTWQPSSKLSAASGDTVVFTPQETDFGKAVEFTASLTVEGCTVSDKVTVNIDNAPNAEIVALNGTTDRIPCATDTLSAEQSSGVDLTYSWSPQGALSVMPGNPAKAVFQANKDMTYRIVVTDKYGCTDNAEVEIDAVSVNAGEDITIPFCEDVQLSGSADEGIVSLEWFGASSISNTSVLTPTLFSSQWESIPEGQTTSTLDLILVGTTQENCLVSDTVRVTALKPIAEYVVGDNTISTCGGSFAGTVNGDNVTLVWEDTQYFNNPVVDVNNPAPTLTPAESAIGTSKYYRFTLTDQNGCVRTDSVFISFEEGDDINIATPGMHYAKPGEAFILSDISVSNGSGDYSYSWAPTGIFNNDTVLNPTLQNPVDGETYEFTLTVTDNITGCTADQNIDILATSVFSIVSLTADKTIGCIGDEVNIDLEVFGGDADNYGFKWYKIPGDIIEPTALSDTDMGEVIATTEDITVNIEEGSVTYVCVADGGDGTVDEGFITISSSGIKAIAGNDIEIGACQTATLDGSGSQGENLSYAWSPLTGLIGDANSASVQYKGESTTVLMSVEDKYGCIDTDEVNILVGEPVSAVLVTSPTQDDCDKVLIGATQTTGEELSYYWDSNTGSVSPNYLAGTQFTPFNGGSHTIQLTLEDKYGCTAVESSTVTADYMTVDAGNDTVINVDETASLAATVSGDNLALPLEYSWMPSEIVNGPDEATTETLPLTQSRRFILRVLDSNGCRAIDYKRVFVEGGELQAIIEGNDGPFCPGETVQLLGIASGGESPYSYSWKDGEGNELGTSADLTLNVAEEIEVFFTVTDATSTVSTSTTLEVTEVLPPVINFTGGGTYYEGQLSPSLVLSDMETDVVYALVKDGTPIDTLTGVTSDKVWEAPEDGDYQIFAVRQGTCENVVSRSEIITVKELELTDVVIDQFVISGSGATTVCKGSTISFDYLISGGIPANYELTWYVDGEIAATGFEKHYFDVINPTSFVLSVTDGYSTDLDTVNVKISTVQAYAGEDAYIGSCNAATLDASQSIGDELSYQWESVAGLTQEGDTPYATYEGESAAISISVTDIYGCTSVDTVNVAVAEAPQAIVEDTIYVECTGGEIDGSGSTGEELSYLWWSADGDVATSNFATTYFNPDNGGYSNLYLRVTDKFGCLSEKVIVVESASLTVDAGVDKNIREGESVFLSGTATGGTGEYMYSWMPNEGLDTPNKQETHTGAINATTQYTLTVTDEESCVASDEMNVFVVGGGLSASIIGGDDEVCVPNSVVLTAVPIGGEGDYKYSWRNSEGDILGEDMVLVLFPTENTEIQLYLSSGNETAVANKTIIVGDYEVDEIVLSGGGDYISSSNIPPLVIENTQVGMKYAILGNGVPLDTISGTGDDYYYNVLRDGLFRVYSYKEGVCGYGISNEVEVKKVEVDEVTIAGITGPSSIVCPGTDLKLKADVVGGDKNNYIYQWSVNGEAIPAGLTLSLTADKTAYYKFFVTDGLTEDEDSILIEVSTVNAIAGDDQYIGACQSATIDASESTGDELSYTWSSLEGLPESEIPNNSIYTYTGTATTITVTVVDKYGCSDSDQIEIDVAETVEAITSGGGALDACAGATIDGSASKGSQLTYTWLPQSGTVSPSYLSRTYFTPTNGGESTIYFIVEDQFGCSDIDTIVMVSANPMVDAGADEYISSGEVATLAGSVSGADNIESYNWEPSDKIEEANQLSTTSIALTETEIFELTATDNVGCQGSDKKRVYVTGGDLTVDIDGYYGAVCYGELLELEAIVNGGEGFDVVDSYAFKWTQGAEILGNKSSLNTTATTEVYVKVTVTDGTNQIAEDSVLIQIVDSELQKYTLTGGGNYYYDSNIPSIFLSGSEVDVDYVLVMDGLQVDTIAGTGDVLEWKSPEDGDYKVLALKEGSCTTFMTGAVSVQKVEVEPLVIEDLVVSNDTVCTGAEIELSVIVSGGDENNFSYEWRTNNGYLSSLQTVSVSAESSNTYTVTITDGVSSKDTSVVVVVSGPVADAGEDVFVGQCGTATLIGSASSGENISYLWESVDGIIGSRANDTILYKGVATEITLTVVDGNGCTATDDVNVFVAESVEAVVSDTIRAMGCSGVQLDASESKGSQLSFAWLPLDGTVTTPLYATTEYFANNGGESEVVISVTDQYGCSDKDTVVVVSNFIEVDAGLDESLTSGDIATLVGTVSGFGNNYTYSWMPEDLVADAGSISTSSEGLTATTIFTLAVQDNDNGCSASDRKWAYVTGGELSVAISGNNSTVCPGESVVLDAVANGGDGNYTYSWRDENGVVIGTGKSTVVNPMDTIMVTVIVSDATGASTQAATQVNVKESSITKYTLSGGGYYCVAGSVPSIVLASSQKDVNYILVKNGIPTDTVSGTGEALQWDDLPDGDYMIMAFKEGECDIPMPGSVTVGYVDFEKVTVDLDVTNDGIYCLGSSEEMVLWLDTTSTAVQYNLLLNGTIIDSQIGNGDSLIWIAAKDGEYTVRANVLDADEACIATSEQSAIVQGYGAPALENDTAFIPEDATEFQIRLDVVNGTGKYSYKWMPSERFESDTVAQPTLMSYTSGETFSVEIVDVLSGCSSVEYLTVVTVKPLNYIGVSNLDNEVCKGETAKFNVNTEFGDQNNLVFIWENSSTVNDTVYTTMYTPTPTENTVYTLIEVSDGYKTFMPNESFEVSISPSGLDYEEAIYYCKGGNSLTLSPEWSNKVTDWVWYDGNSSNISVLKSLSLSVDTLSTFYAVGRNEYSCVDSVKFIVDPIAEPIINSDTVYWDKSEIVEGSIDMTKSIFIGANDTITDDYEYLLPSQTLRFADVDLYDSEVGRVDYMVTKDHFDYAGKDSFIYTITSDICPDVLREARVMVVHANKRDIFAPVGFSPNGDGINDYLEFEGLEKYATYKLHVFSRWGTKVYEATAPVKTWDGKANVSSIVTIGEDLPDGTYYYIIEIKGQSKITGFVELMR